MGQEAKVGGQLPLLPLLGLPHSLSTATILGRKRLAQQPPERSQAASGHLQRHLKSCLAWQKTSPAPASEQQQGAW